MPRLLYTLRTAPCAGSVELEDYDNHLRATLSQSLNIDLNDDRWRQASLPVRWGGLGTRGAVQLAPSAYLASAAGSSGLVQRLLPIQLHTSVDPFIATSLSAWHTIVGDFPEPSSSQQRIWDDACCRVVADDLLTRAADLTERTRLLASRAEGSGDWLRAIPLPAIGLKLDNAAVRIAVGLRLGAPLVHPHTCVCGAQVETNGGTDLYVARVLDVTRDTTSSTISCCAVSSVRGFWRHANPQDSVIHGLGKGPTGLHRCHGPEGDV